MKNCFAHVPSTKVHTYLIDIPVSLCLSLSRSQVCFLFTVRLASHFGQPLGFNIVPFVAI